MCARVFEYVRRHHRCEQTRNEQRHGDGDGCCPAKLHKKLTRHAAHKRGGQKHRDQTGGCGNHRHADFVRAFHRCLIRSFAHLHVAHDIFDLDNRIVDEHTNHQRQGEQGNHVEAKVHQADDPKSRNDGQR